ncbi:jg8763 [Pararge aegeria aegeria]|uniref:Jg8763 protein n=1 Tax=Pararge aegeria aegeria TaxID=348720 RepID=A0A8S4S082_9NEOP|nr:jg8763 [Pararge aegeria aegeria]
MLQQRLNKCPPHININEDSVSNGCDNDLNLSETFKCDEEPDFIDVKVKAEDEKANDTLTDGIISVSVNATINRKSDEIEEVDNVSRKSETLDSNNVITINDNGKDSIEQSHKAQQIYEPGDDIPLSILKENKKNLTNNIDNITQKFTCLTCFEVFKNQLELLKHYQHIELEKFNKNNKALNTETKLVKYKTLPETDGSITYKCERCYKKYKHKKCIDRHVKSHIDKRPYLCKLCGKTYQTASIIVAHGKMHSGEMYSCAYRCGYQSVHKHVVMDHEKRHRKEYKYKCETCGKGFQVRTWFQQHQNIHNDVRPFRCDQCDKSFHLHNFCNKSFQKKYTLKVHEQTHAGKRYLCNMCDRMFTRNDTLVRHIKTCHTGCRNKCLKCDKVFPSKLKMAAHQNICTPIIIEDSQSR